MHNRTVLSHSLNILMLLAFSLSACAPLTQVPPLAAEPAPTQPAATRVPDLANPTPEISSTRYPKPVEQPTFALTPAPILGEAPESIMAAVLSDLEKRAGSAPVNLTILRSEAVTWNDGSLGCPKRGMFYTQATVEGYWVVVQLNAQTYDYRIASRGPALMLCEK